MASTEDSDSISVIVLNWNGWRDTVECLESVYCQDHPRVNVIVVDNGSNDESVVMIRKWAAGEIGHQGSEGISAPIRSVIVNEVDGERIGVDESPTDISSSSLGESWGDHLTLVRCSQNLGYAGGMNTGIRHARAIHSHGSCLLLNNDLVLGEGFFRGIEAFARKNPSSAIVQGKVRQYYDRARFDSVGNEMDVFGGTRCRGYGDVDEGQYDQNANEGFFYVSGAAMFVQGWFLDVFRDTDFLDPILFAYHEDVDVCWFARILGFNVSICTEAVCYHKGGSSLRGDKSLKVRYFVQRNNIRVLLKNYGLGSLVTVLPTLAVGNFLIAALLTAYHLDSKYLRVFAEAVAWNARHFHDTLLSRRRVQSVRKTSDHELRRHMVKGVISLEELVTGLRNRQRN